MGKRVIFYAVVGTFYGGVGIILANNEKNFDDMLGEMCNQVFFGNYIFESDSRNYYWIN